MNLRLVELYEEASEFAYKICKSEGRSGGPADHIWHTLATGKFAELIVNECADIVEEDGSAVLPLVIKRHFGVAE